MSEKVAKEDTSLLIIHSDYYNGVHLHAIHYSREHYHLHLHKKTTHGVAIALFMAAGLVFLAVTIRHIAILRDTIPIEKADEHYLDIGNGLLIWFRTWGNRKRGTPVLFLHGGPGQAIADYNNENSQYFDATKFFVVEADQRGTGKSKPSVRDDWNNFKYYTDISIEKISADYEAIRKHLGIDQWLIFGGSWGSTVGLDYSMRYPHRVLGLIIRAIFLDTKRELMDMYGASNYVGLVREYDEWSSFFELASQEAVNAGEGEVDADDTFRIMSLYEHMFERGDKDAFWRWWVFENNLMETDPSNRFDYTLIVDELLPVAQSVSFFEDRLFLRGGYEDPIDLLKQVPRLRNTHTWVCQGTLDNACPNKYAAKLLATMLEMGVPNSSHFITAGHLTDSPEMAKCLKASVNDFREENQQGWFEF